MPPSSLTIAKIVKSNSHVDYVGRVIDTLDVSDPPRPDDYGFAQFVTLAVESSQVIGVIYNTLLFNPEYGNFGPRLSPRPDLAVLSPDYLNEQGVLVGVLLLGWQDGTGKLHHGVPRRVIPVGCEVVRMDETAMHEFHIDARGKLQLHYYSQIIAHAGTLGIPLIEAIIEQLEPHTTMEERQRLCVLKKSLVWQRTLGGVKL